MRRTCPPWVWFLLVVLAAGVDPLLLRAHGPAHERIAAITAELDRDPRNAGLLLTRAELRRSDGDSTNALADLDLALASDPNLVAAEFVRGRVFLETGRPGEAVAALDRYLARKDGNAAAFLWRARARAASGDAAGASVDYDAALRVEPLQGPDAYLERARHLRSRGPGFREATLAGLREALDRLGPLVTLELEAVDVELELGRAEDALARLERIAARSQRPELWRVRRAEILEGLGRTDEARLEWQAAAVACGRLPERLRQTPALRELQDRIGRALGAALPVTDPPLPSANTRTNTTLRRASVGTPQNP